MNTWITNNQLENWFRDMRDQYLYSRGLGQKPSIPHIGFLNLEPGIRGRYLNPSETGSLAQIIVSSHRRWNAKDAWETLLHEAVHHTVYELCCSDDSGHGRVFCTVANDVAKRLGYSYSILPETHNAYFWPECLDMPIW